jgi:hypothetical protein
MRVARPGALTPLDLPPLAEKPLASVLVSNYMACGDGSTDRSRDVIEKYQRSDARRSYVALRESPEAQPWARGWLR